MKRKLIFFITATMTFLLLVSCSKSQSYREDVKCTALTRTVRDKVQESADFSEYGEEEVSFLFSDLSFCDDHSLMYSAPTGDISEIGIFHCPDEETAKDFLETVTEYIEDQKINQRTFISSYAPRELEKLDHAEVRRYGTYVIYVMLDDENRTLTFDAIENVLKK